MSRPLRSVKLPERPAYLRYSPFSPNEIIVTTYQLDNNERIGSLFVMDAELNVKIRKPASGGIFRVDFFPNPEKAYAALTTGRIGIANLQSYDLIESREISEGMLLNLAYKENKLLASDERGNLIVVDSATFQEIESWRAHNLPGTSDSTNCEVWSCSWIDENVCASGSDDTLLKIWDLRINKKPTFVNKSHDGGVVFLEKRDDFNLISGSYDEHIRSFDLRILSDPILTTKTNGGSWSISEKCNLNAVACMYGGWQILDKTCSSVVHTETEHGSNLLYGVDVQRLSDCEFCVTSCTFNDSMVHQHNLVLQ